MSINEVAREPFIFREESSGTTQAVKRYFRANGINTDNLNTAFVLTSHDAINDAVERRMGISIVSRWTIRDEISRGDLVVLPLKEGRILRKFYVATWKKRELSFETRDFVSHLKSYCHSRMSCSYARKSSSTNKEDTPAGHTCTLTEEDVNQNIICLRRDKKISGHNVEPGHPAICSGICEHLYSNSTGEMKK